MRSVRMIRDPYAHHTPMVECKRERDSKPRHIPLTIPRERGYPRAAPTKRGGKGFFGANDWTRNCVPSGITQRRTREGTA